MKRVLSILLSLCLCCTALFAEDEGDDYDDGFVYTANGAGDKFLKVNIGGYFPVNFQNQLYPGGAAELGFYYFVSDLFAVGGEFSATYNISVGNKNLLTIPITGGIMFQPVVGNFEFPIFLNLGVGYETWQNYNYFPSLVAKAQAGVFYRFSDTFSVGLSGSFLWIPQWYADSSKNTDGMFASAVVGIRYHF